MFPPWRKRSKISFPRRNEDLFRFFRGGNKKKFGGVDVASIVVVDAVVAMVVFAMVGGVK